MGECRAFFSKVLRRQIWCSRCKLYRLQLVLAQVVYIQICKVELPRGGVEQTFDRLPILSLMALVESDGMKDAHHYSHVSGWVIQTLQLGKFFIFAA